MHIKSLLILGLCLVLVGSVIATTNTQFSDGSSTFNASFWYNGSNVTAQVLIPTGSTVISAVLNVTGYQPILLNQTIYGNNNSNASNPYRGYWFENLPTSNPELAYDGDYATYSTSSAGTYHSYAVNFSSNSTSAYNITYKVSYDSVSVESQCWNVSSNSWIVFDTPLSFATNNVAIPSACYQGTNNLRINFSIIISSGSFKFYDINITEFRNNTQYPHNFTIFFDGLEGFNYGSSNNSDLDHKVLANITSAISSAMTTHIHNITFRSNTSGGIFVNDISFVFNDNSTILIKEEATQKIYNASNVTVIRIITPYVVQNLWTTTGIINAANLNYSGVVDVVYQDVLKNFPLRHAYYYNTGLFNTNSVNLSVINDTNTTKVLFTLYRENGQVLPEYYIAVQRKYFDTDTFVTVEMHKMDFNGQALLNVELYNVFYRIKVYDTNLTEIYTSTETQIKSSSLTLTVSLVDDIWNSLILVRGVQVGNITFNNATNQLYVYYNDVSDVLDSATFNVRRTSGFGNVQVCTNVSTQTSNTLYCTIDPNLTGVYIASLVGKIGNSSYLLNQETYRNTDQARAIGRRGMFVQFFILIGLVSFGLWNPAIAIIMAIVAVIAGFAMSFVAFSFGALVVIIVLGIMLAVRMRT